MLGIVTGGRMGQTREQYRKERELKRDVRKAYPEKTKTYRFGKFVRRKRPKLKKVLKLLPSRKKVGKKEKEHAGPGRPRETYKHRHPLTGKPIPATEWYKVRKKLRRRAKARAEATDIRQQQLLARRGISPEEARAIEIMRLRRIAQMQALRTLQPQLIQTQPISRPQQMVPEQLTPLQIDERKNIMAGRIRTAQGEAQPQQFRIIKDLMTGRDIIKPIPPRERWTYGGI
jgi:hypothetical protein